MKLWLISDTHTLHKNLIVPKDIDTVCFIGDATNTKSRVNNTAEFIDFIDWFVELKIDNKIFVPGNHDTSFEGGYINMKIEGRHDIITLINASVIVGGIKFYGSPYSRALSEGWAYSLSDRGLHEKWKTIDKDTDILLTHMPPYGILDKVDSMYSLIAVESVGNKHLRNKVFTIAPKIHAFGHIHDARNILNGGSYKSPRIGTIFMNTSCVTNNHKLIHNGITIDV